MKIQILTFALLISCLNLACDTDPCENFLPSPEELYLNILNIDGESLISNLTYNPDSIIAYDNLNQVSGIYFANDSLGVLGEWDFSENVEVFLQLSSSDTDTLELEYLLQPQTCKTVFTLLGAKYNGDTISFEAFEGNHKIDIIKE